MRRVWALGTTLLAIVVLDSCGGARDAPIATVAGAPITRSAIAHLAAVLTAEHVTPPAPGESAKRYALALLLVATWTIDEAQAQGVGVSSAEAKRTVDGKVSSSPGGSAEFQQLLKLSGRTLADVSLAERERLAGSRLMSLLASREPPITHVQVADYYRRHKHSFATDEQRRVTVLDASSRATAEAEKRAMASPGGLSGNEAELLEYAQGGHPANEDALYTAIYASHLGVPTGPVKEGGKYFVFRIFQIIPSVQQSLAAVEGEIGERLRAQQHQRAVAGFVAAWQKRWVSRTSCQVGWVIPGCRQYRGTGALQAGSFSFQ
jgi:hypothetical protein